jgi:hypothetical protein
MKLLGQENCSVAGGTRETESVGDVALAAQAMAKTHERKKDFTPQ